jgi:hypothetical protein
MFENLRTETMFVAKVVLQKDERHNFNFAKYYVTILRNETGSENRR